MIRRSLGAATLAACLSCSDDQAASTAGLDQPIQVESAQFVPGALPGQAVDASSGADAGPHIVEVTVPSRILQPRQAGTVISGHATPDSQAVAVRFAGLGSGYFVAPVGAPDPSDNDQLTWQLTADFGDDLAPGFHDLLFAAVDAVGESGTQFDLPVCVDTPVPDNLNACSPSRPPPAAVVSLTWNTAVDLDLIVQTPSGARIGGKTFASTPIDGGAAPAGTGVLDRDSNRDCVIDGIQREDIVWQASPPLGTYEVWVDLFSACSEPSVTFAVSLWLPESQPDGTQRLVERSPPIATGILSAAQANGGATSGLFVGSFILR